MKFRTAVSRSGTRYRLRTRTVKFNFATVGQVVALDGEVVAETEPVPYGFTAAALGGARRLVEEQP